MRRPAVLRWCTSIASVLLGLPFILLVVAAASFAAGVPITRFHLPVAAIASLIFAGWVVRRSFLERRVRRYLGVAATAAAAFSGSWLAESAVSDMSWDGRTYHALAIERIADGWNPIRGSTPAVDRYREELHYFAKGPWVLAAAVQEFSGSVDGRKVFNLPLMLAAYLFWAGALLSLHDLPRAWAFLAPIPIAVTAVSGAQLFTHYVDGQLGAFLAIVMALLVLSWRQPDATVWTALAMAVALAIATKLTGALYVAIFGGGFLIWRLVAARKRAWVLGAWLLAGGVAGAGVIAYNPYTSQFARATLLHGNAFHPHPHWSSILALSSHGVVPGSTPLARLGRSLLAPSIIWPSGDVPYKLPFTLSRAELREFASPDVRLGGFGPLFSGALVLAGATLVLLVRQRDRLREYADLLVLAGSLLVGILVFEEAWWARLGPQLAFLPVLIAVIGLAIVRRRSLRLIPAGLVLLLGANSALVLASHVYYAATASSAFREELDRMKQADSPYPIANLVEFPGLRSRLDRAGVAYFETDSLPCPESRRRSVGGLEAYTCQRPLID